MEAKDGSAFLEYFGDTPKLRLLDFLIGNHFFDFNMTDMAKEAGISYNSLQVFFGDFLNKGIIIKTRRVGKSDMYKLNMDNVTSQNFVKFAWFLTKQDLGVEEKVIEDVKAG
tara:strand:- start:219 stop:554 length:336 start_codon:yes stop_codon:yes gene_type:complete